MRGWLRDFVDHDLAPHDRRELEEHVHLCRVCSVELGRAEHERLMVRRAFARLAKDEPSLRPGLAARVVQRLVLDETSLLSKRELIAAREWAEGTHAVAAAAALADSASASVCGRSVAKNRSLSRWRRVLARRWQHFAASPTGLLAASLLLLVAFGTAFLWGDAGDRAPVRTARLVVTKADQAYGAAGRRLESGDGLGDLQSLWVSAGGGARVEWHDVSPMTQPAATLEMRGSGEVRLQDGAPLLVNGKVGVVTNRAVSIPMADGSSLSLGIGEYVITAEVPSDWLLDDPRAVDNPLAAAPDDLRIGIEVVRGESAQVVRSQMGTTMVVAGNIGVYQGKSSVSVRPGGGVAVVADGLPGARVPLDGPPQKATIAGIVFDRSGLPSVGAAIGLSYLSDGILRHVAPVSGSDGNFSEQNDFLCGSDFAIVQVRPAALRVELGSTAPQAFPVVRLDRTVRLLEPLVLDLSEPLTGTVRDDLNHPRGDVRVLTCIIDELFGTVLPSMGGQTATDAQGNFQITQLPSRLPPHQYLAVLLLHPGLEPRLVPIPARGTPAAQVPLEPMIARRLRTVRLHMLPANVTVQIFEEVTGLPGGTAAVQRPATTDGLGRVDTFQVGWGRLWFRTGTASNPFLRELVPDEVIGVPRYRPSYEPALPLGAWFRSMGNISGTNLQIVQTYRHQRFCQMRAEDTVSGRAMVVVDSLGRAVPHAQVFAVAATGPRGSVDPRFLGLTSMTGVISLSSLPETRSCDSRRCASRLCTSSANCGVKGSA